MVPYGTMLSGGKYRLTFDTGAYFAAAGIRSFYPTVTVFVCRSGCWQHHHVPLVLNPYGYSTYRGS